ncbi:MAG TPA: tetratricopeptide repeat protein [Thermoanaerobaculia bacterium]|nr:tetratricopeptide repeat protein [Thermoanaerobaculia bacterium]
MKNTHLSPRLCAGALLLLTLTSSCAFWTPRSRPASQAAVVIPNMPMQKWGIESCGAGALSTVLQHYGDPVTMAEWDSRLPKIRGGVLTLDLLIAARERGFDSRLITADRATVENELLAGRPVILMLQVVDFLGRTYDFFHYIVIDGIDRERRLIRAQFGDARARWITFDRIEKAWSGGKHTAILIAPRDPLAGQLRAAVMLEEAGKFADAEAGYLDILRQRDDHPVAWTNLGNVRMQLGRKAEAETAFRKALSIDANNRDAANNLAWLLFEQRRYDEAEQLARKAAELPGADRYLVLDTLARVLAAKGACSEAQAAFRRAIAGVPSDKPQTRADLERGLAETTRSCS